MTIFKHFMLMSSTHSNQPSLAGKGNPVLFLQLAILIKRKLPDFLTLPSKEVIFQTFDQFSKCELENLFYDLQDDLYYQLESQIEELSMDPNHSWYVDVDDYYTSDELQDKIWLKDKLIKLSGYIEDYFYANGLILGEELSITV